MGSSSAEAAYAQLEVWVERKLGLHFSADQKPAVRRRLEGLAARLGERSPAGLLDRLSANEALLGGLMAETVATNHTGFFRESNVLEHICGEIVPQLGRRRERIRIWSAAGSTGEEAYSVAMLLAEHHGTREAKALYTILATDLVQNVVARAEAAEYSRETLQSVSSARRLEWFQPKGADRFLVKTEIREMCTFRRLNLISEPWPFKKTFSIVLCRNVLYYFDKPVQRRIVERIHRQLEPDGWLLTSVSENLQEFGSDFQHLGTGLYRRRGRA